MHGIPYTDMVSHDPDFEDDANEAIKSLKSRVSKLEKQQGKIMSTEADLVAAQAALDGKIATVGTDVAALIAKVATLDPAAQAAIDAEVAALTTSSTALGAIDTEANPVPAPVVTPSA
jgi:peptidoglycan hydrolase CwlO-like protein